MISITGKGDFKKTRDFLSRATTSSLYRDLDRFGQMGVQALASATPIDSSLTSQSWGYRVIRGKRPGIEWFNTNRQNGSTPVAILIQYGHGTRNGGYVSGIDYINPAIRPIFDKIADDVWKKVTK